MPIALLPQQLGMRPAEISDIPQLHDLALREIGPDITTRSHLEQVFRHNRDTLYIGRPSSDTLTSLIAILPLTEQGIAAIGDGVFTGQDVNLEWVAPEGAPLGRPDLPAPAVSPDGGGPRDGAKGGTRHALNAVAGVYVWGLAAYGRLARAQVLRTAHYLETEVYGGLPLFASVSTERGAKLATKRGFRPFPNAGGRFLIRPAQSMPPAF